VNGCSGASDRDERTAARIPAPGSAIDYGECGRHDGSKRDAAPTHGMPLRAYCETCKREFYGSVPRKFCDVPTCRGYLIHIDRGRHART